MKFSKPFITALAMLPLLAPSEADAAQRCKTYTKTIRIDGQREIGYGKACQLERGVWEIVKTSGIYEARDRVRDRIYEDLYSKYDDDTRVVIIDRDHDYYDRDRYDYGYSAARYYSGYPHNYSRNYGQYKKQYKHSYKNKPRVHYHGGKECGVRH